MKLYEISDVFDELFNQLDEISDQEEEPGLLKNDITQAWFDILDGIEEEFKTKAENVAVYIKNLNAEVSAIKKEEDTLKLRRNQKEKHAQGLKQYLLDNMKKINLLKIDTPRVKLSINKGRESVRVADEQAFIKWALENNDELLRYKNPEINKTAVKLEIDSGVVLPFAELVRNPSLTIK